MAKIVFKSNVPRHTRELNKADFTRLGVEDQGKLTFPANEPTEVSDAVAEALLKLPEFEAVSDEAKVEEPAEEPVEPLTGPSDEGNTTTGTGGGTRDGAGARSARTR